MISESKFWNNFGKFSAVVGTIAAIVTLVAFFSRSGSEEIDPVSYTHLTLPTKA